MRQSIPYLNIEKSRVFKVDVREVIDAYSKFDFESEFQNLSSGGAISYVEIPNLEKNVEAVENLIYYIYDHIQYAEFNTKSDYCHECGFSGEIIINDDNEWECPNCGNKDHAKMNVTRRTQINMCTKNLSNCGELSLGLNY